MQNLNSLLTLGRSEEKASLLSNVYEVKKGGFGSINEGLNSYICSTTIVKLVEDIETFEKLTSDKSWPVSQIIQREIDQARVRDIANQYILAKRNVKYFPPIVVVILPKNPDNESISDTYQKDTNNKLDEITLMKINEKWSVNDGIGLLEQAQNESQAKELYILNVVPQLEYRLLVWDKKQYYCVVIDGQHRLESLKFSLDKDRTTADYRQDIVFIDVSNKAIKAGTTPVQAVRNIFIDINNNATPVTQARKYVMDDKDLASLFVQSLVNDDPIAGSQTGNFLEPQLVDWHADNLKHELPHLTGILALYQLMSDVVIKNNLASIDDLRHEGKVTKWITRLNTRFLIDEKIKNLAEYTGIKTLEDSLKKFKEDNGDDDPEEEEKESYLFEYDYNILKIAQKTFVECYCRSIVKYFYNLKPYAILLDGLRDKKVFNIDYNINRIVIKSNRKMTSDEKKIFGDLKKELVEQLDPNYYLVFTVLGQKTLFELFFKEIDRKINNQIKEEKILAITNDFLNEYNRLFDVLDFANDYKILGKHPTKNRVIPELIVKKYLPNDYGFHSTSFWEDIIYRNGNTIIYNSQGINAMKAVFEYMIEFCKLNKDVSAPDSSFKLPQMFEVPLTKSRMKKALVKQPHSLSETVAEETADKILKLKKEFLDNYLIEAHKRYIKSKMNHNY